MSELKSKIAFTGIPKFLPIFVCLFWTLSFSKTPPLFDLGLTLTISHETCLGNGSLQMTVTDVTPGASVIYDLYLHPDLTNPIAQTTTNSFNSLQAGNYRVVATEILNDTETSVFQDATIENQIEELDYTISHSTASDCDSTGTLTVNIISGNPQTYEIVSGPVTVPPQTSESFSNLPSGVYVIRVYDDCEDAVTKTYTLNLETNDLGISESNLPVVYDACDSVTITNDVTSNSGEDIIYPLEVTYTVFPPDGSSPITYTQSIATEGSLGFQLSQTIPLFGEDLFDVRVVITDQCNNVFEAVTEIDPAPKVVLTTAEAYCGKYLQVAFTGYYPPFSITFTESPPDFNPADYNEDYPGPYDVSIIKFGDDETALPEGIYTVEVTDSCGRTSSVTAEIIEEPVEPNITESNLGCDTSSGKFSINIPDRLIISAEIIEAPDAFLEPLPFDLSSLINEETVMVDNMPVGDYLVHIVDECGDVYDIEITIPEFVLQNLFALSRPDCDSPTGSLNLYSPNGKLETALIISAPAAYTESLPHDVSNSINSNGSLYLYQLPEGGYTFDTIDVCGNQFTTFIYVTAYNPTPFAYNLTRNCGSFDIAVSDNDTSVTGLTYWFQKFFPDTNSWGHPYTGVTYTEGTIPDSSNAIQMFNDTPIYNIFLTGEFRIIKAFQSFNQNSSSAYCLDIFEPFIISSNLIISNIYSLDCEGGNSDDIVIDAIGVEPFNFSIVSPISYDNGNNNTFSGLAEGIYEIKVEDACGNIENINLNTENLLPLARAYQPDDMLVCNEGSSSVATFDLSSQTNAILGSQDPDDYIVTYYTSQANADSESNPITNPIFTSSTSVQTIYARVEHETIKLCYATTSFNLRIGNYPPVDETEVVSICEGETTILTAPSGYSYEWSNGQTTQSIIVDSAGSYSVTLKNLYGDQSCESIQEFSVVSSGIAHINDVTVMDWTSAENTISINASGLGDYQYSLDDVAYQDESFFTDLPPGVYTVYVKDVHGCGTISQEVVLLNYPKFFTPNGDAINDHWHIRYASLEPGLEVTIFDRYGKLITHLNSNDYGWDGSYNGYELPTSDYWFLVTRADGRVFRGHFTLKR